MGASLLLVEAVCLLSGRESGLGPTADPISFASPKEMRERNMARTQGRNTQNRSTQNRRTRGYGDYYVDGSTARQLDVRRAIEEEPRKKISNETRKNRERAHHMNFGYVVFLALAMMVAGYVLIGYIQLQAETTAKVEKIASLEKELNNLKLSNDDELARINSNVNLDEIKRIAIGELGMVYAQEGQIVYYNNEGSDYVRQFGDIPKQ